MSPLFIYPQLKDTSDTPHTGTSTHTHTHICKDTDIYIAYVLTNINDVHTNTPFLSHSNTCTGMNTHMHKELILQYTVLFITAVDRIITRISGI